MIELLNVVFPSYNYIPETKGLQWFRNFARLVLIVPKLEKFMDVDVFMQYMAGALHAAEVELTDSQWEAVSNRLHDPLPKLTDGQLFAYTGSGDTVMYEMFIDGNTDLEEYAYARPLTQQEMGGALLKLVQEYRTNGFGIPILTRFDEAHPFN